MVKFSFLFISIYTLIFNIPIIYCNYKDRSLAQDVGNWYEKLQWWKKAGPLYDSIIKNYNESKIIQSNLNSKIDKLKDDVNKFFDKYLLSQNEFSKRVLSIISKIKDEKLKLEEKPDIDSYEDDYNNLQKKGDIVESIFDDLNNIKSIDKDLSSKIPNTISNQISRMVNYKDKASTNLKKIEDILDDKIVYSLYLEIENDLDNSSNVLNYLKNTLDNYLDHLNHFLNKTFTSLDSNIKLLEDNYDLYIRDLTKEEIDEKEKLKQSLENRLKESENIEDMKDTSKVVQNNGFFNKILSFFGL